MKLCQNLSDHPGSWWEWVDDSHGTLALSDLARQAISYFRQKYKARPKVIYVDRKSRIIYLWRKDLKHRHAEYSASKRKGEFNPVLPKPKKPLLRGNKVKRGSSTIKGRHNKKHPH